MRRSAWILAAAAMLGVAAPSASAEVVVGAEVYGSFNSYGMKDVNDNLRQANLVAGTNFDEIRTGFAGGLGVRLWPNANWMLSATWEPLFARSENTVVTSIEYITDANAFLLSGAYFFPTETNQKYGLGAGVGFYRINGELKAPAAAMQADLEGSAVGFHVLGLAEWTMSPGFAVHAAAGYRNARVDDTQLAGQSGDPKVETDYSGFTGRLGLAFYLPSR